MANITRFDPFTDFDDLLKGFFVRPMRFELDAPAQQMSIKVDVTKADGAYGVKAELPGVKKDDIHVAIDGSRVTISGEVKNEKEEKKGEEVIRSERYCGKVSRTFTLAQEVDEGKAEAKYVDGVLTLTLPMKAKSSARKVTVS